MSVNTRPSGRQREPWRSTALIACMSAVLHVCIGAPAVAQRRPVVFVHGFASSGATWQVAADSLASLYPLVTYRPSLAWNAVINQQATDLITYTRSYNLPDTTIAIGHSNGGIVSRTTVMSNPNFHLRGVVTVASPQQGAPLAQNVWNGNAGEYGRLLAQNIAEPFAYYSQFPDSRAWTTLGGLGYWLYQIGYNLPDLITGGIMITRTDPLIQQMIPGSPFLDSLNGAANRAAEATRLPVRVAVRSQLADPTTGSLFAGLIPSLWVQLTAAQTALYLGFLELFEYYNSYGDFSDPNLWNKRNGAYLWLNAAGATIGVNENWCYLIGAWDPAAGVCLPHDGIVPWDRQAWVGTTDVRTFPNGPAHFQEASQFTAIGSSILETNFNVLPCRTQPPVRAQITNVPANVGVGTTKTVQASVLNLCDQQLSGYSAAWTSSNPTIATVTGSIVNGVSIGNVTGVGVGTATITANIGGKTSTAAIRVTQTNEALLTSVSLQGAARTVVNCPTEWTAVRVGGASPVNLKFFVGGVQKQSGTSAVFWFTPSATGNVSLQVQATDARGDTQTANVTVTVASTGVCATRGS